MTAIVTNAKNRIAYNIVKSLGRRNVPVITSDFLRLSMSFFSRYSKGHFIYPSPFNQNNEKFIDCLIDNIIKYKADVLIPVSEETFLVSKFKNRIEKYVGLALPEYSKILIAHNKDNWETVAKSLGIDVPDSYDLVSIRKNSSELSKLPYPLLIKPKQGGGGWGISRVNSPKELENILQENMYCKRSLDRFYIQRMIVGETHCVAMLFKRGELKARITYKQLREYPLRNGQATLRISLNNQDAELSLKTLLEYLEWHGVCQADFVIDKKSNIPYLIDLNPRFWGSIVQSIASGVDFPYLYYKLALEKDVVPVKEFKTGVVTRWIGGDMRAFFPLYRESAHKFEFMRKFFFPVNYATYKDDFNLEDPLPFTIWFIDAVARAVKNRSTNPMPHDSLEQIWK